MRRNPYRKWTADEAAASFPFELSAGPIGGFSRHQMELLVAEPTITERNIAPWRFWDTELYSQGLLLRAITGWPLALPIPLSGDHGAVQSGIWPRAFESDVRHYVTASVVNFLAADHPDDVEVHLISSPWSDWIKGHGIGLDAQASGTVAFLPHLLPGTVHTDDFLDRYVAELKELPSHYQPVVVCVQMHDVKSRTGERIRAARLPVITAGHTSHPLFFFRWVELARRFRYGTSPSPGSDLVHFHQLGGEYFIYGPPLEFSGSLRGQLVAAAEHRNRCHQSAWEALCQFRNRAFSYPPSAANAAAKDLYVAFFTTIGPRLSARQLRKLFFERIHTVGLRYWLKWCVLVPFYLSPHALRESQKMVRMLRHFGKS